MVIGSCFKDFVVLLHEIVGGMSYFINVKYMYLLMHVWESHVNSHRQGRFFIREVFSDLRGVVDKSIQFKNELTYFDFRVSNIVQDLSFCILYFQFVCAVLKKKYSNHKIHE